MSEQIGLTVIACGLFFEFAGCVGLVRLPDVYNRLQAGAKCVTLGVCLILLGAVAMADSTTMQLKALLCAAFILLTSPTAAHALARAARFRHIALGGKRGGSI